MIFRWRMTGGWPVEAVTENVAGVFGHSVDDFVGGRLTYADVVHPDDFSRVSNEFARCLKNGADRFQHEEYRIRHADGSVRWLQDFTVLQRDENGVAGTAVGFVVDVSARKLAELELHDIRQDLETRVAERTAELNAEAAEREAAKTEAEATKALLQDALESTTEAFALFDDEGRLVIFNEAYRRLYRHSKDLLQPGMSFEDMLRDRAARGMIPDVGDDVEAWVQWRMGVFTRCEGPVERIFPDGSWWKMNEQRTSTGGIAQILTDITEIKEREEKLRESEDRFRNLFEHTSIGAAIIELDGGFRAVNQALCNMLGYSKDELVGMSLLNFAFPEDQAGFIRALGAYNAGEADAWPRERRFRRKDGQAIMAEMSVALVRDVKGRPVYVVGQVQDLCKRP